MIVSTVRLSALNLVIFNLPIQAQHNPSGQMSVNKLLKEGCDFLLSTGLSGGVW